MLGADLLIGLQITISTCAHPRRKWKFSKISQQRQKLNHSIHLARLYKTSIIATKKRIIGTKVRFKIFCYSLAKWYWTHDSFFDPGNDNRSFWFQITPVKSTLRLKQYLDKQCFKQQSRHVPTTLLISLQMLGATLVCFWGMGCLPFCSIWSYSLRTWGCDLKLESPEIHGFKQSKVLFKVLMKQFARRFSNSKYHEI